MRSRSVAVFVCVLGIGMAFASPRGAAQTDHSGTCAGTFTAAGNPHRLTSTCSVPAGQTLTLASGVVLEGQSNTLVVNGTLNANGATFSGVFLAYRDGGGGTLESSTFVGNNGIDLSGSSAVNAPAPLIRNNTITSANHGIDVGGTARPTLTNNTMTVTNGAGLRYSGTAAGTATGNTIHFTPEGGSGRRGIEVSQSASPRVENNTVTDDPQRSDIGLQVAIDSTSTAVVRQNSICVTGGDEPIVFTAMGFFEAASTATVTGNTFPCTALARVAIQGTVVAQSQLEAVNGVSAIRLRSTLTVAAGATLTIPAGMPIEGQNNLLAVNGTLNANNVPFTSVALSYRDGSGGTLENSTLVGNAPIDLSGSSTVNAAAPLIRNNTITGVNTGIDVGGTARPTLTNNSVTATNGVGLRYSGSAAGAAMGNTIHFTPEGGSARRGIEVLQSASPRIENNTVNDDPRRNDIGLQLGIDSTSTAVVRQNSICVTGGDEPIIFTTMGFFEAASTATVTGNTFPCAALTRVGIQGTVAAPSQLEAVNGANVFRLRSTLTVAAGATLTIPAGMPIEGQNNLLAVNGTLNANNVPFTSVALSYRDGSGGTLENSTLVGNAPIDLSGSSTVNAAAPLIRNNTITGVNSGIDVGGTARPTLTNNTVTVTNGAGLRFSGSAAGTAMGNTIHFAPEGGSGRRGIEVSQSASPRIENNTVTDDPMRNDIGLQVAIDSTSTAVVRQNSICATGGDEPIVFTGPGFFAAGSTAIVTGNTFPCGALSHVGLQGTVAAGSQLEAVNGVNAFRLQNTFTVAAGATLTIPAGVSLDGQGNTVSINGTLNVTGTAVSRTFFSFRSGSAGTLTDVVIDSPNNSNVISVSGATVTFRGSRFEDLGTAVLLAGASRATFEDNLFRSNRIAISIEDRAVVAMFSGNTFEGNGNSLSFASAEALFSAFPAQFTASSFTGGADDDTMGLPSILNVSGTLRSAPIPYGATNGFTIASGNTLVIEPGTVVKCGSFRAITVDGELVAAGTPEAPIVFTTFDPKSGTRWGGLLIKNKQSALNVTVLRSCVVEFANTGVTLDNASIPIEGSIVADNSSVGISLLNNSSPAITDSAIVQNGGNAIQAASGSNPQVHQNELFGNGGFGVQNQSPGLTVNAESNFWGDDTGPRDFPNDQRCSTLSNPDGAGEEASDCVDYDPWLRVGPSIEGTLRVLSGGGQSGPAGTTLPQPLVVEIRSLLNSPLADIAVIFSVVAGDASIVEAMPVRTAANGRASARVRLGSAPGSVIIAVTARDVDSPLATFMAEAAGPCLIEMKIVRGTEPPGELHGSPVVAELRARPVFVLAGGPRRVEGDEETVFSAEGVLSADGLEVAELGPLHPAPEGAAGNELFLKTLYVASNPERPEVRRLYVSLEGSVREGRGGVADLGARLREIAEAQTPPEGGSLAGFRLVAELRGLTVPGGVWLEPLGAQSAFQRFDALVPGHDPGSQSLRLLSPSWVDLSGPGAALRGGGSSRCESGTGAGFRFELEVEHAAEDLAQSTALRWVVEVREETPLVIVCIAGSVLDDSWIRDLAARGAVSGETASRLAEQVEEVRQRREEVHASAGRDEALAALGRLEEALADLSAAAAGVEQAMDPAAYRELQDLIGAARTEVAALQGSGQFPGDMNQDRRVDVSDVIALLDYLFLGDSPDLPCEGSLGERGNLALLDFNGDGRVNITDPVATLRHLFSGGPPHTLGPADSCVPMAGCPGVCEP